MAKFHLNPRRRFLVLAVLLITLLAIPAAVGLVQSRLGDKKQKDLNNQGVINSSYINEEIFSQYLDITSTIKHNSVTNEQQLESTQKVTIDIPTSGYIGYINGSAYGDGTYHQGIDIWTSMPWTDLVPAGQKGNPVYAPYAGEVLEVNNHEIIIYYSSLGITSWFDHMASSIDASSFIEPSIKVGTQLKRGDFIGYQGSYAIQHNVVTHLHFQIWNGRGKWSGDNIDPANYFDEEIYQLKKVQHVYPTNGPISKMPSKSNGAKPVYRFESANRNNANLFTINYDSEVKALENTTIDEMKYLDVAFYAFDPTGGQKTGTVKIYRYKEKNRGYYYYSQVNAAPDNGVWESEGIAFYAYDTIQSDTTPIFQYYKDVDGVTLYYYTKDQNTVGPDWTKSSLPAFYAYPDICEGNICPVSRFFHSTLGYHFYTINQGERDTLIRVNKTFKYEGDKFWVYKWNSNNPSDPNAEGKCSQSGTIPVYRFFNKENGASLYTISEDEKNTISSTLPKFVFEGKKFCVFETQVSGTIPVYRFFNKTTGAHLYITNENEKNDVLKLSEYKYEGIKFYVNESKPIVTSQSSDMIVGANPSYHVTGSVIAGINIDTTSSQSAGVQSVKFISSNTMTAQSAPAGMRLVSSAYSLNAIDVNGSSLTSFDNGVFEINFDISNFSLTDYEKETLTIKYFNATSGAWEDVPSSIDLTNNVVNGIYKKTGTYALFTKDTQGNVFTKTYRATLDRFAVDPSKTDGPYYNSVNGFNDFLSVGENTDPSSQPIHDSYSLINFGTITDIPGGAVIKSAELDLWQFSSKQGQSSSSQISWVERVTQNWTESEIGAVSPTTTGDYGEVYFPVYGGAPQKRVINLNTSLINYLEQVNYGIAVKTNKTSYWSGYSFCSRNIASGACQAGMEPKLIITYEVPINHAPSQPRLEFPFNDQNIDAKDVELRWHNSYDPDGDAFIYNVFLGENANSMAQVGTNLTVNTFKPNITVGRRNYYWKVQAFDVKTNSSFSEVGNFYVNNHAPSFGSNPSITTIQNANYSYQVAINDADNDAITYSLKTAPLGMIINSSGLVSWKPSTVGSYEVEIKASDGIETVNQKYTIYVVEPYNTDSFVLNLGGNDFEGKEDYPRKDVVKVTADGGYIVASSTNSFGAGDSDIWVVKMNSLGEVIWQKTVGNASLNRVGDLAVVNDGYIVIGEGNVVVKFDLNGNLAWQKTYPGYISSMYAITSTTDGGAIIAGAASSTMAPIVLKIDPDGFARWVYSYGSIQAHIKKIIQTKDGGYMLVGQNFNFASANSAWVIKIKANGAYEWNRVYYNTAASAFYGVTEFDNGDYVFVGYSGASGSEDMLIMKTNYIGSVIWEKKIDNTKYGYLYDVKKKSDNSIIVAGVNINSLESITSSWYAQITNDGAIQWQKGINTLNVYSLDIGTDQSIVMSSIVMDSNNKYDLQIVKTNSSGNINRCGDYCKDINLTSADFYLNQITANISAVNHYVVGSDINYSIASTNVSSKFVIGGPNQKPVITTQPGVVIIEGTNYSYQVVATDANHDTLYYSLKQKPESMSIDSSTGLINWTPSQSSIGDHIIEINVSDGDQIEKQIYTLTVMRMNVAPNDIFLSNSLINENQNVNYEVGSFSSSDLNPGDTFNYSLVDGAGADDNSSFKIENGKLTSLQSFDFEKKLNYLIRCKAIDQDGLSFEKAFVIKVLDLNEAPQDIILSQMNIDENQPINIEIGTLSTVDPDAGGSFSYQLTGGTGSDDNENFSIIGNKLRTNKVFNFEERNSYSIRIKTQDQNGLSFEKTFVIEVNDINEAPALVQNLTPLNSAKEQALNTKISWNAAGDPEKDAITYDVYVGTDMANLSLVSQGKSDLSYSPEMLNNKMYYWRVDAKDPKGLITKGDVWNFITKIKNNKPTSVILSTNKISENLPSRTEIGILSTKDPDLGNRFVYSLVTGKGSTNNNMFSIDNDRLKANETFDYETKKSYSIRVRSTDQGGLYYDKTFTINVSNVNEAPSQVVNISPIDNSINQDLSVQLMWSKSIDPEKATVKYDLYFGENEANLNLKVANLTSTKYTVTKLERNKKYYWQIKSKDSAFIVNGPVTNFTTYGLVNALDNAAKGKVVKGSGTTGTLAFATDGIKVTEGAPKSAVETMRLNTTSSYIIVDLGTVFNITGVKVQVDDNDSYSILTSKDGKTWTSFGVLAKGAISQLVTKEIDGTNSNVRYVKLKPVSGDGQYFLSEVEVYGSI